MGGRSVRDPDGRIWLVRRRWVPRLGPETVWGRFHKRYRQTVRHADYAANFDLSPLEIIGEGIVATITVLVFIAVLFLIAIPLLVAFIDLAIVVLLAVVGLLVRIVLRRPWTVEAIADDGTCLRWRIVGWRQSGERLSQAAELLAAGVTPPGAVTS